MDNTLFEEMLQEIDAMTADEYWALYKEAEKLIEFPPIDAGFIQVQYTGIPVLTSMYAFNNTFDAEPIFIVSDSNKDALAEENDIWLKAA